MVKGVKIVVEELVKIYDTGSFRVIALKGVSLKIFPGEIVTIMGPSGSGKTTLLNIIGGVDKPSSGKILVNDEDITRYSEERLRKYRLYTVGYIFQFFNLIPTLNALENTVLPMILAGKEYGEAVKRAEELLKLVGLEKRVHHLPSELSGGERQRLAIAIALANDPPLILADEPTGELDIVNAEKVLGILAELAREKGKTIIVSTHDPRIARLTDRIYILQDGLIKGEYAPEKISGAQEALEEVSHEKIISDYLKKRIDKIDEEINILFKKLLNKEITVDEFIERYSKLKMLKEAYIDELGRLGLSLTT